MADWLKNCEICNVGLCTNVDELKAAGNSLNEACRLMEAESDSQYASTAIRERYRYYKGKRKPFSPQPTKTTKKPYETCTEADLKTLVNTGKTFGAIYADPPWAYGNQSTRAATSNHYETMSIEDIAALPVGPLAAEQAHLHLWTTNAFLFDAPKILEAWGFEYKSCFIWVKPQMGIGNYWRVSHEFMLLGVRGGLTFQNRSQMSWQEMNRTKHSRKPEAVRKKIEAVSPGPYLELFGRVPIDGWTVWGNEIEANLFHQGIE